MAAATHQPSTLRTAWALTRPYFASRRAWKSWLLVAAVVAFHVAGVSCEVLMSDWNRRFFNAAQEKDLAHFTRELEIFPLVLLGTIFSASLGAFFGQLLRLEWRAWLTRQCLGLWLKDHAFYRIRWSSSPVDNPDQRISDGVTAFVDGTVSLATELLSSILTLGSFATILWHLSGDGALHLPSLGLVHIPGILVWGALIYAGLGTGIIHRVGKPLVPLHFQHERREGDFRFALVNVRENAENIALYGGETAERSVVDRRFQALLDNFWAIIRRRLGLQIATSSYTNAGQIIPWLLAGQRYFAGGLKFGDVTQAVGAFGHVRHALSVIVNNYAALASWRATVNRLAGFALAAHETRTGEPEAPAPKIAPAPELSPSDLPPMSREGVRLTLVAGMSVMPPAMSGAAIVRVEGAPRLSVTDLATRSPKGLHIGAPTSFEVAPGERVLLTGPSGSGKSTLLKALSGIWPFGSGQIEVPAARAMFLTERTYLPLGALRDAVCYPSRAEDIAPEAVARALARVGLERLVPSLDETADWAHDLPLGEQQRMAFARALLVCPSLLVLDEATSALDDVTEAAMYGLVATELSGAVVLSAGHKASLAALHTRSVTMGTVS
jgi:putative ATP-binding cassette transporter